MGHFSFILCLVSSILACPFQCMSGITQLHGAATAVLVVEHCTCCPHQESSPAPALPCTDDECCGCVCEGAVLNSQETLKIEHLLSHFSVAGLIAVPILGAQRDAPRHWWDDLTPSRQPGRALRLALHSLQV